MLRGGVKSQAVACTKDQHLLGEGARWDARREELLRVWRSLIQEPDGALAHEPLATLGESLALDRHRASASGAAGRSFDFGAYEIEGLARFLADHAVI